MRPSPPIGNCVPVAILAGSPRAAPALASDRQSVRALTANIVMQCSTEASTPACTVALSPKAIASNLRSNLLKPHPAAKSP